MSKKQPRFYQKEICNAIVQSWGRNEIPYGSVLGGLGKSLCFAMLTDHYVNKGERVLQLVPRLELVEQNANESYNYMENKKALGIVCGQLNKKQNNRQAIIAMASSFVGLRTKSGSFDRILVDECVTGDTEILTEKGFVRFDLLNKSLKVAQYDNGSISFVNPLRHIEKHYKGEMIHFKSDKLIDLHTTAKHEMLVKWEVCKDNIHDRKVYAKDINFSPAKSLYVAGNAIGDYYPLSVKEKMMIMTQADGNIFIQGDSIIPRISFVFTKQRKIDEFLELMKEGNFRFSETKSRQQKGNIKPSRIFHVFDVDYADKDITKFFDIDKINNKNAKDIIEYMVKWDGNINKKTGQYYYSNTDEKAVDFYQSICVLAGYKTNKTIQIDNRSDKFNDIHRLFITKTTNTVGGKAIKKTSYQYDGMVYCVTVPSGNIIVRRNNKVIIIGNCHRVVFKKEGNPGIYEKIIKSLLRINPNCQVCGLSGSSFRMDQGELHDVSHKTLPFFTHKVYDTAVHPGIPRLISEGYLAHIHTLNTNVHVNLDGVKVVNGDYSKDEAGKKFDLIIDDAVADMKDQFIDNNIETAIIFVSNLTNAKRVLEAWGDNSTMRIVCGNDEICTKTQRKQAIEWIKSGTGRRFLLNIDLLAEGFDYTALQCVVLLRATKSPGLMSQIIFRIIRPHADKEHSFLLDYGTNCERMGTVDSIIVPKPKKKKGDAPRKICLSALEQNIEFEGIKYKKGQDCNYANLLSAKKCKKCSAEFINETEDGLYTMRTKQQALQAKIYLDTYEYSVDKVYYEKSYSRKDQTEMIKCRFYDEDVNLIHDHYLTLNHSGFARDNAIKMLISMLKNKNDYAEIAQIEGGINVDNALLLLDNEKYKEQYFKKIKSITIAPQINGKFKQIKSIGYE